MSTRMSGSPTREGWPCISACWAWCRCRHLAGPAEAAPTDRLTLTGNANDTTVTMHLLTQDGHHHTWGEIHWADFFTGCVREHQTTDPTPQTWSGLLRESSVKGQFGAATQGGYATPLYDGPDYWVRVCGNDWAGDVICTDWN